MIFFAYASPMPGSASRSAAEAVLMSSGPCFVSSPLFASALPDLAGVDFVAGAEAASGRAAAPRANRSARTSASARTMGASSVEVLVDAAGADDAATISFRRGKARDRGLSAEGDRGIMKRFELSDPM